MTRKSKILLLCVIVGLLLTVTVVSGCCTHRDIRVHSQNHRLTGYNSAYDVSCDFLTTQAMYNVILIKKD